MLELIQRQKESGYIQMKGYPLKRNGRRLLIGFVAVCVLLVLSLAGGGVSVYRMQKEGTEADRLAGENQALTEQIASLEKQMQELQDKVDALSGQAGSLTAEKVELASQLEEAQKKIQQLEQQLASSGISPDAPAASVTETGDVVLQFYKPAYEADTKLIALTFDDGPGKYTERLLDELKARGLHATFFVVGQNAQHYPALLKRMVEEGHVIGNHTMNHKNLTKLSESEVLQQINACADIVENASGVRPYLLRCPGGNVNDAVKKVLKDQHLALVNWSVDTRDWQSRNTQKVLETAFQSGNYGIRDGAIVLMHDVYETTLDAAVQMMDRLIADGYTIVTVPELLAARHEVVYAGVQYHAGF